MMSAPLILSSDVSELSSRAVAILGNKGVIAIDQDALGQMATLVRRSSVMDILFKPLRGGDYAISVLNRGTTPIRLELRPSDFGFAANEGCTLDVKNLWSGTHQSSASTLQADVASHDTEIWHVHPASSCGAPARTGTITMIVEGKNHDIESYSGCLTYPGRIEACAGTPAETWVVTASGALKSGEHCLSLADGNPVMKACRASKTQQWNYTLVGNLVGANHKCLTSSSSNIKLQSLSMQVCGHNRPEQIWSLPN
jgi:alpha-galactosidase